MPFQKVKCDSKSLQGAAHRPLCWTQTPLRSLSSSQSGADFSSWAANNRCSPSLPGRQNPPESLCLVLHRLFFPFLLLWAGDPCVGLRSHIPRGRELRSCNTSPACQPLQGGLSLSASSLPLPVSTWLLQCYLDIIFQIGYTSIGFSS